MNSNSADSRRAAGTEDRAWVGYQGKPYVRYIGGAVSSSQTTIRVRDGLVLSATLHTSEEVGKKPGILIANGYGAAGEADLLETIKILVGSGYLVLCARMRGIEPSAGKSGLYEGFATDSYDLVEWLAERPECNGRVGMVGASLLGLVQYLCAREAPPSLRVIVPDDAGSDNYWYLWHPGGMRSGPGRAGREAVSGAENEYRLSVAHPNYDTFWRERTVNAEDLKAIARRGVAVFLTSGWDSYLLSSTKSYEWLRAGEPGSRLKMFVGPWPHGVFMSPRGAATGPEVLPFRGIEYCVRWLDRWLKGTANGVDQEPPVLIYVQGPDEWRFEQDWPIPDERRVRLYLRERESGTRSGLNDGSLSPSPPGNDGSVAYDYSPDGPYNMAAVTAVSRPRLDKSPYEAHALVWTSEPLAVSIEMTGYPRFLFWAALSASDTDFVVEITDVVADDASGALRSRQVTRGYLNAMRYFSRSDPQPLVPDVPYRFEVELYPTSYVFPAKHRIRITLQGAAIDPRARPLPIIGGAYAGLDPELVYVQHGPGLNEQAARVAVLQDALHASFVELPIIGAGRPS